MQSNCEVILGPNSTQSEMDNLSANLTINDGLYLFGHCMGLKINEGMENATNGTLNNPLLDLKSG